MKRKTIAVVRENSFNEIELICCVKKIREKIKRMNHDIKLKKLKFIIAL